MLKHLDGLLASLLAPYEYKSLAEERLCVHWGVQWRRRALLHVTVARQLYASVCMRSSLAIIRQFFPLKSCLPVC